ncbi:hypothetical protein K2X30_04830 [bacterium]|nr:hypothetical protein [bacterium]
MRLWGFPPILFFLVSIPGSAASNPDCDIPDSLDPYVAHQGLMKLRGNILQPLFPESSKHACEDSYVASCSPMPPVDSTGHSASLLEAGHNKVNYENQKKALGGFAVEWAKLPPTTRPKKEDYLIDRFYKQNDFDEKLDRVDRILKGLKGKAKAFSEEICTTADCRQAVDKALENLKVVRDYKKRPGLLSEMRINASARGVEIGGLVLTTITSEHALALILSHELGHVLSSALQQRSPKVLDCLYEKVVGNLPSTRKVDQEELWADWAGGQIFPRYIAGLSGRKELKREAIKSALRTNCGMDFSSKGHLSGPERNRILTANPKIQDLLCFDYTKPRPETQYCPPHQEKK